MTGGIEEINPQGCIWTGDTWVMDIISMLIFLANYI